jgi:hypothetical protein
MFTIAVTPGNQTVPRGEDLAIEATTSGFDPERAQIHLRYSNSSQWEVTTMTVTPDTVATFRYLVFNVQEPLRYYVSASGYRSDEFLIEVSDLPRVDSLDYAYSYPQYAAMDARTEEDAFDIVALRGTRVTVTVHASQELEGGTILFADDQEVSLTPGPDQTATAAFTVDRSTTFHIRLVNTDGNDYTGLTEYAMEALDDQKPLVQFTEPGRDFRASNVEEVFTELEASDDIGVTGLRLRFAVNGGEEQVVTLFSNNGQPPREQSGSYTFFLEDYDIEPGDFVSYYGEATDSRQPANTVKTDIYFIQVRPFGLEFSQGQAPPGGGGGGGGGEGGAGDSAQALADRQREIISATFNLIRDRDQYTAGEFSDNIQAVAESQSTLADQAQTLMGRLGARQLTQDDQIAAVAENMELALAEMGPAAQQLR